MTFILTKAEDLKLLEAAMVLRLSPAFPILEAHLQRLLDDYKNMLVTNTQPTTVPNLQGRAQQLTDILEILHRKQK